ncbi:FGGY-family carbohydrate kinase [Streptomyces sp. NPDC005805]|uniref:FGGY-family carbohydrate kinase n=1 Tax=Streptomyces sp. NPDC005805 TaxID=3157068 RepID=UPI003404CC7F
MWLGIDLGTQGARALLADDEGRVLGSGSAPLTGLRDGARHEQSPEDWWTAVCAAVRAALADAPPPRALAVCATSGTVFLGDAAGRPLTPALMYDDGRAPGRGLGRARWLARTYPPGPGARIMHQADLITTRLTGHPVPTDSGHALKTGYDPRAGAFTGGFTGAEGAAEPDGTDPGAGGADLAGTLPEVVPPGSVLGEVCAAAEAATGIPRGTPVVAGTTDGCAAQLASGSLTPGSWNSVLGTTLVLKGVSATPLHDPGDVVYNHLSADGSWLPGGASATGAGALRAAFPDADPARMDALAAAHEPAATLAYPLVGRGERFPFTGPEATAFLLGSPESDAEHWAALLQGVALVERLCLDYLDHLGAAVDGPLTVTGGAVRSAYWTRLRAEVLGRELRVPESAEPALGMAVLAAYGAGGAESLSGAASRMVRLRTTVRPGGGTARWDGPYLRLVDELARRGWLPEPVAAHARARTRTRGTAG